MKLYIKDDIVVAIHEDHQTVPPSAYGENVSVVAVAQWSGQAGDEAPDQSDAEIVSAAAQQIDHIADRAYTASASRVARYERKYDEALRYRSAGYPHPVAQSDYPTLTQEAPVRGLSKRDLADLIIARAEAFALFAGFVEARRAALVAAVAAQDDAADKRGAAYEVIASVAQAAAALG